MADYRDVMGADHDADSAQASLETYCGQIEDGQRTGDLALVVGLAAIAICERIEALEIRGDYLVREVVSNA